MTTVLQPKVGLLALTLELYETLAPGLRAARETWLREGLIPALQPLADVQFDAAVFRREDIESTVARYEAADVDAILIVLLTYSPSQLALPVTGRTPVPAAERRGRAGGTRVTSDRGRPRTAARSTVSARRRYPAPPLPDPQPS